MKADSFTSTCVLVQARIILPQKLRQSAAGELPGQVRFRNPRLGTALRPVLQELHRVSLRRLPLLLFAKGAAKYERDLLQEKVSDNSVVYDHGLVDMCTVDARKVSL